MVTYWPAVQYAETDPNYDSFWEHEWTKHGTCSGLTQQNYFQDTINLIEAFGTPASVTAAVGGNISASGLRNDFGGANMVSLQCNGGVYLSGAFTCWSRNSDGSVGTQTVCPADVQTEDTCTGSSLVVTSLP